MLTSKQKRYLKSMANTLHPIFQIGKDGLSENLYNSLKEALKTRELIKISVLKSCDIDMNEVVIEVLANTNAELVQKIGKTLVLYKQSKERKIILP